jgi:PAS domain S-box-containing protein
VFPSIAPEYVFMTAVLGLAFAGAVVWRRYVGSILEQLSEANRTNEELGLIINNTSDGIVLLSMTGRVLWANDPYLAMHGYTLQEILDRNPLTYALPPEDRPSPAEIATYRFDPADPQWRELHVYRNIRKDGSLFWNQILPRRAIRLPISRTAGR